MFGLRGVASLVAGFLTIICTYVQKIKASQQET
jgi:hypothetical protein